MSPDNRYLRKRPPLPGPEWQAAIEAANARRRRQFQPEPFAESSGGCTYPLRATTHHRRKAASHERIND